MQLIDLPEVERAALHLLLSGDDARRQALRRQLAHVVAVERTADPVGVFVDFALSDAVEPLPGGPDFELAGVQADSAGVDSIGFLLFVRGGRIALLEGYVAGDRYPHDPERTFTLRREGG